MGLRGGGAAGCGETQAAPRPVDPSRKRRSGEPEETGKKRRLSGGRNRRRRRALPPARHPRPADAPFNSTQFLMSDHVESEAAELDSALGPPASRAPSERTETAATAAVAKRKGTRARESSFSLDSDEDYYYSSPEDEEEFVCQEFIKEYNSQRRCRLVDMSKADLIQEYLQMEQRVDNLSVRLNRPRQQRSDNNAQEQTEDTNTAEQIRHYQREILRLEAENEKLRSTNASLMQQKDLKVDTTPSKPASDSDCSTCSSCSSSSSSEDEDSDTEKTEPAEPPPPAEKAEAPPQEEEAKGNNSEGDKETDTGYESSNSGSNKALKGEATSTCNNV